MSNIIEVKSLRKKYGNIEAVKGVSFTVQKGELFAFLGPNGAGKSTCINTLCTLLRCEEGEVIIGGLRLGKDDNKIRNKIGVAFQDNLLDNVLTIRENLFCRGSLYGLGKNEIKKRIEYISNITGTSDFIDRRYEKLSGGQRRRADLARALINEPEILFLDEPTTGLDPATRQDLWKAIIKMQKEKELTVFLTTHYMEEAANADNIVVISCGKIIAQGTPSKLKDVYTKDHVFLYGNLEIIEARLKENGTSYKKKTDKFLISFNNKNEALKMVNEYQDIIETFEVIKGNMDDMFLNILDSEVADK